MVLEVPLPLDENVPDHWRGVASNLRSAEEECGNGSYRSCITSCRILIDELGGLRGLKWFQVLKCLGGDLKGAMTKPQGEQAVWAALWH